MGVYGTYGAFNGLGKPSIKLEFEDNEALLDFQRRMQEGGDNPDGDTPDGGGNFTQGEQVLDRLSRIATGRPYLKATPGGEMTSNEEPVVWNEEKGEFEPLEGLEDDEVIESEILLKNLKKDIINNIKKLRKSHGQQFNEILAELKESIIKLKILVTGFKYNKLSPMWSPMPQRTQWEHLQGDDFVKMAVKSYRSEFDRYKDLYEAFGKKKNFDWHGLGAPGDVYMITDTRTRARKDLENTAAFRKFDVKKVEGGATSAAPQSDGGVVLIPIFDLNFDTKNFQNREDEYSETSVNRIIDAVADGEFNWAVFDPITVWRNPSNGKIYVLSGHSRSEAFRRLTMQGAQAQGRKFDKIPAKIFDGTFEQARELALNSNTLSTKETDIERANYYRERRAKLMERGGKPSEVRKQLLELARKNEGKNANRIIYLSYLTPRGITYDALKNLQNAGTQDRERMTVAAEWIGHLRYQFPQLTEMHENELYRFLITNGHYGSDVRNFADFAKRVQTAIEKNTEWGNFNADKALNMERNLGKSENEKRYDAELARLKKEWVDADDTLTRKLGEFKARQRKDNSISDAQIVAAARPYKDAALIAKANYLAFRDKRGQYLQADERQMALFGKVANDALYNNLEILDYRGMQPTYRQLSNYDAFFKPAANKNSLKGWGLNDTKKLIADICRNHYKECAAIAKHLKAETKLQSAFNLWHWLHHNIRYEYDREGREEVRTPARVWADRHRGVDCDCLSVFAWCVLKCMGYNPAFELAAFRNKPAYSHIYINLDGIVIDRVWYVFNSRPPFITKTELFKVGMLDNLGQLF